VGAIRNLGDVGSKSPVNYGKLSLWVK